MIKNLLYSLFLHFILLISIYISFNVKTPVKTDQNEVIVTLVPLTPNKNISEIKKAPTKTDQTIKEEKKKPKTKKADIEKPKKKPKQKKAKKKLKPKKIIKTKPKDPPKKPEEKEKIKYVAKEIKKTTPPKPVESATDLESLDLSAREKLNMRSQIKRCYSRAVRESEASSRTIISIVIHIDEDGYIKSNLDDITDIKRYNDPLEKDYKLGIDNIRRTIDLCSPLRNLPADKYDIWKKITLDFGSRQTKR